MTTAAATTTDQRRDRLTDRSQLLRLLDAICSIQYPTETEVLYRQACIQAAAAQFGMQLPSAAPRFYRRAEAPKPANLPDR